MRAYFAEIAGRARWSGDRGDWRSEAPDDDSASSGDGEELLTAVAEELAQQVTVALSEVLLDGPVANLHIADPRDRFTQAPVEWWFSRGNRGHRDLRLEQLSRAERSWAQYIIREELFWHRRSSALFMKTGENDMLRPVLTLLDEPEGALHRAAEAHMARSLRRRAADPRKWILAATHSPELLDAPDARITEVAREFRG